MESTTYGSMTQAIIWHCKKRGIRAMVGAEALPENPVAILNPYGGRTIYPSAEVTRQHYRNMMSGWYDNWPIPEKFKVKTLDDFRVTEENKTALEAARAFVATPDRNLVILGYVGTGKTYLASLVALATPSLFANVPDLVSRIFSGYRSRDGAIESVIEALSMCPVLVLDDLGTSPQERNESVGDKIYQIVNNRYVNGLPTVVTTNLKASELINQFPRVFDRLREGAYMVTTGTKSLRGS